MNMLANTGMIQAATGGKGQPASLPAIAYLDYMGVNSKSGAAAIGAAWAKFFKKVSKYTVQFTLPVPNPNFNYNLWNEGRATISSTQMLLNPACGTTVVSGTGPFKVKSKGIDKNKTVLEANPNYWRSTATNKLPKAQQVTFLTVGDAAQCVAKGPGRHCNVWFNFRSSVEQAEDLEEQHHTCKRTRERFVELPLEHRCAAIQEQERS
jgi:ABC-type oligopeptide transport system substrate-binding subunit